MAGSPSGRGAVQLPANSRPKTEPARHHGRVPPSSLFPPAAHDQPKAPNGATPVETLLGDLNDYERRNAPSFLYLAGDATLLSEGRRISVVGSRRADARDLDLARLVTEALVRRRITVVSGLAEGIDTVAHETAMALDGRTMAVLGTPLSRNYPRSNADLQQRIARKHLVVSEFGHGTNVVPANFVLRNRTMALVSDATIIVAAGASSGTRHQGWEAIRLGRDLAILEPLTNKGITWVESQLSYGASAVPLTDLGVWLDGIPERLPFDESLL